MSDGKYIITLIWLSLILICGTFPQELKATKEADLGRRIETGQGHGEDSGRCGEKRDYLIPYALGICTLLCIGGISLSCWALFNVNERRLGAALEIIGLSSFAIGWLFLWGSMIFGLPPGWPPCYPW